MDALFQRLADTSRSTVGRVHGTAITVYPTERAIGPNGKKQISGFTAYEAVGCFFENTLVENDALVRPLTGDGRMMSAAPAISVSIRIPEGKPFGDNCLIKRHRDGAAFEVSSFKPDGLGGVLAAVNFIAGIPGDASC